MLNGIRMNYNSTSNTIIFYNLSNAYRNASNYFVNLQYSNLNIVPPSLYNTNISNINNGELLLSNLQSATTYYITVTSQINNNTVYNFPRLTASTTANVPSQVLINVTTLFPALDSNIVYTTTFNTIQYSNIRISSNIRSSTQIFINVYDPAKGSNYTLYNRNIQFYTSNALNYMTLSLTNLIQNTQYNTTLTASNARTQQFLTLSNVNTNIFTPTISNVTTLFPNLNSNISIIRTFNTIQYSNIRISSNITNSNQILINLFNYTDNFRPYTNNITFYNSNGLSYMSLLLSNLIDDTLYNTTLRASNANTQQNLQLTSIFTLSNLTSLFPNSNLNISIIKTYDTIQYSNIRISSDITSNNQISINLFNNTNNSRPYSSNIQLYTSNGLNYINLLLSNLIDNTIYTTTLRVSNGRRQESLTLSNVITNINPPIIPVQPVLVIYNNYNSITYSNIKPAYFTDNISQYSIEVDRNFEQYPTVSNIIQYRSNTEGINSFIDISLLNLEEDTIYGLILYASNVSGIASYVFDSIITPLSPPYFPMGLQNISISCNATSITYYNIFPAYNDYANTYSVIVKDSFNTLLTQPTINIINDCNIYTITIDNITPQILYHNIFVATNMSGSANLQLPYVYPVGEVIYDNFTTANHNTIIWTKYDILMETADFLITQPPIILIETLKDGLKNFTYASYTYYKKQDIINQSNATVQLIITNLFPDRIYNIVALDYAAKNITTSNYTLPYFNEGTAQFSQFPYSIQDGISYYVFKIQAPLNNDIEFPDYCTVDITPSPRISFTQFVNEPLLFESGDQLMLNIIIGLTDYSKYYIKLTSRDSNNNIAQFQFPEFTPSIL